MWWGSWRGGDRVKAKGVWKSGQLAPGLSWGELSCCRSERPAGSLEAQGAVGVLYANFPGGAAGQGDLVQWEGGDLDSGL